MIFRNMKKEKRRTSKRRAKKSLATIVMKGGGAPCARFFYFLLFFFARDRKAQAPGSHVFAEPKNPPQSVRHTVKTSTEKRILLRYYVVYSYSYLSYGTIHIAPSWLYLSTREFEIER
jgi:hypothetical protein